MSGEMVDVSTPCGVLCVEFGGGTRTDKPSELHIRSAAPIRLGRFAYNLRLYVEVDGDGRWRLAHGSVSGRRSDTGGPLTAAAGDILSGQIVPALVAWVEADSPDRRRALALWCQDRARHLYEEADRLHREGNAAQERASQFVERAARQGNDSGELLPAPKADQC